MNLVCGRNYYGTPVVAIFLLYGENFFFNDVFLKFFAVENTL